MVARTARSTATSYTSPTGSAPSRPARPRASERDATITVEGADFLRLATGQLHPVRGVLTGALKVKGERTKALALNAVMVPPQPRKKS